MSKNLLFAKIVEPEMTVVNLNDHFRDQMGKVERGNIEVFTNLWNLRPYDKTNDEIVRIHRLMASFQNVKEQMKDWGDYRILPEEAPEFRRMLLGADIVLDFQVESF